MAPKLESWVLDASRMWVSAVTWGGDHVIAQSDDGVLVAWRTTERGKISLIWRRPAAGRAGLLCVDSSGEHVIVATHERAGGGSSAVRALSLASGEKVWETRVDGAVKTLFDAEDETWVFSDGKATVISAGDVTAELDIEVDGVWARRREGSVDVWGRDRYVCLSPPPGVHWIARKRLDAGVESVTFGGEYTVTRQEGGKTLRLFRRFDPIWGQTLHGAGRLGEPRLDEALDRLFVALSTGEVVCWELSSGEVVWQGFSGEAAVELHTPRAPVLIDGFVVVALRSGRIAILDRETGQLLGESAETEHRAVIPMGSNRLVTTGSSLRIYRLS